MIINTYFQTLIGQEDYDQYDRENKKLINRCTSLQKDKTLKGGEDWVSKDLFNSFKKYDLFNDKDFKNLNNWITEKALQFAFNCGYNQLSFTNKEAWFNIYKKGDYQEFHDHNFYSISAIFFLKSDREKDAKTYFESPLSANISDPHFNNNNPITWRKVFFEPIPGRLLLFRSNLKHCVEQHQNEDTRISLAYNFSFDL